MTHSGPPPARLLDLSRLVSRAGRRATGVDRVERAYLDRLIADPVPLYALVRSSLGYVLLDRAGAVALAARLDGAAPWGGADRLSRLARGKSDIVRRAESDLRRFALDRCLPSRLGRMLAGRLPPGTAYLNVGHSNLTDRVLFAVRHAAKGRVAVLIHDAIPLDFPHYQRAGTPQRFAALLRRVRGAADLVIYNSDDTRGRAETHMRRWGSLPPAVVAHLGVPVPMPGPLPDGIDPARPWFVALGTIEPRKGTDLLLDVWETLAADLGPDTPQLFICGARGWNNDAVFARLDRLAPGGAIRELPDLTDGEVAALLAGAQALLHPSRAEGFGLPPVEAAALGVPVLCSDLPAIREVLGDIPVYLNETDRYQWRNTIECLLKGRDRTETPTAKPVFAPPTWEEHFKVVLRFT